MANYAFFAASVAKNSVNTAAGNFGKILSFSWEVRKRILRGQDITLQGNRLTKPEKFQVDDTDAEVRRNTFARLSSYFG